MTSFRVIIYSTKQSFIRAVSRAKVQSTSEQPSEFLQKLVASSKIPVPVNISIYFMHKVLTKTQQITMSGKLHNDDIHVQCFDALQFLIYSNTEPFTPLVQLSFTPVDAHDLHGNWHNILSPDNGALLLAILLSCPLTPGWMENSFLLPRNALQCGTPFCPIVVPFFQIKWTMYQWRPWHW